MRRCYFMCVFILFSVISFAGFALANGVLLDGMGPISTGRGGTNIAQSDNGILIHDNPAALARMDGKHIEVSVDLLTLPMSYTDPYNDTDGKDSIFILPTFAYTYKIDHSRFGFGVGIFNPAGFSTEHNLLDPNLGDLKYFSDASLSKILLAVGWQVADGWSVGFGVGPAYSRAELETPYTFQTGVLAGTPSLVKMKGDDWSFTWNFGTQWEVSSQTTVGLAYTCREKFDIHGDMDVTVPTVDSAHYNLHLDFKWPQTLGGGILHKLNEKQKIAFDVLWIDWSSAFNELTFKLSEGTSPVFNFLTGGSSTQDTLPLRWKDSYACRLGYEYMMNPQDTLRFGYVYNKNPVPCSTLTQLIPGILKHAITLGYGHNWEKSALNIAYQHSFKNKESVGISEIIGGDFDHSSVEISAHYLSIGFQYKF